MLRRDISILISNYTTIKTASNKQHISNLKYVTSYSSRISKDSELVLSFILYMTVLLVML